MPVQGFTALFHAKQDRSYRHFFARGWQESSDMHGPSHMEDSEEGGSKTALPNGKRRAPLPLPLRKREKATASYFPSRRLPFFTPDESPILFSFAKNENP